LSLWVTLIMLAGETELPTGTLATHSTEATAWLLSDNAISVPIYMKNEEFCKSTQVAIFYGVYIIKSLPKPIFSPRKELTSSIFFVHGAY
jgi:hypothetical protein